MTSSGAKNVMSPTGGSNWPLRCLDIILSSWTRQYACDWRRVWRIMALKLTEEWRPWQRKSKLLSSWIILVAWAVHLRVDNKITLSQRAAHTCARILKMCTEKPEEVGEVWTTRKRAKRCDDQWLSLLDVPESYLGESWQIFRQCFSLVGPPVSMPDQSSD